VAGIGHAASQLAARAKRVEFGRIDLTDAAQAKISGRCRRRSFRRDRRADQYCRIYLRDHCRRRSQGLAAHVCSQCRDCAERLARGDTVSSRRADRIVNIGAMGALQAGSGMGPYGASKAGVHKLTETLAAELKGAITVNAVLPSIIDTVANRASMPKADPTKWVAPKELADVILFLASDAGSAVTGALLQVNGRV
jgi:NAD(P)-dependent dehydrogenase (short-subunit alcohol dehydrogenase family)